MSQHLQLAVLVSENQPPFQEGWGTHHPEPRDLLSPSARVLHSPQGYQRRGYPQAPQGLRDRGPAQPPPPVPAPPALPCRQTSIAYTPKSPFSLQPAITGPEILSILQSPA